MNKKFSQREETPHFAFYYDYFLYIMLYAKNWLLHVVVVDMTSLSITATVASQAAQLV